MGNCSIESARRQAGKGATLLSRLVSSSSSRLVKPKGDVATAASMALRNLKPPGDKKDEVGGGWRCLVGVCSWEDDDNDEDCCMTRPKSVLWLLLALLVVVLLLLLLEEEAIFLEAACRGSGQREGSELSREPNTKPSSVSLSLLLLVLLVPCALL